MRARVLIAAVAFAGVALAHFAVAVAGQVLALRVAFDTQSAGGAKPFELVLVRLSELLLAPLELVHRVVPGVQADYPEIALTSAGFGVAAAGTLMLWRRRRGGQRQG